jgi:hypothetical protein
LARSTGIPLADVQQRLTHLEQAGMIVRSTVTKGLTFHLAEPRSGTEARPTAGEAAERDVAKRGPRRRIA